MKGKIIDNLLSNAISLFIGVLITVMLFFFTSNPVTPEDVKKELLDISLNEITERYGESDVKKSSIDKLLSPELDAGSDKSIILVGSVEINDQIYRWISIFERKSPGLFDTIVGRSGFFELTSLTSYEAQEFNSLLVDKIEVMDLDDDGVSEIHIRVQSIWADSISSGPLILRKGIDSKWGLSTLPSISIAINSPLKISKFGGRKPYTFFGMVNEDSPEPKSPDELKKLSLSEESWMLNHNGEKLNFTTLRNGGDYIFRKHPIKGYSQIQTLTFFNDGGAVLGPHYAVVNTFKLNGNSLDIDELWNWEYPMYTTRPLKLSEINMDSVYEAGIKSHIINDTFFGYSEYQKINQHLNLH